MGPDRGIARVYVDGVLARTVDLGAASPGAATVVFRRAWGSAGLHRLRIVVVGTAGRPRVDVDAFAVLR